MHWPVVIPDGFDFHTAHNYQIFLFDPLSVIADQAQTTTRQVFRRAVLFRFYDYTGLQTATDAALSLTLLKS